MSGETLADRYERTMTRFQQITRAGYEVRIEWECEFDDSGIVKQKPELLTHPVVEQTPLKTRDAMYGSRTEAVRLHHEAREDETIQCVDVISLYPYIYKYFKFPIGHPVIHVGDTCKDKEAALQKEGLVKCLVLTPKRLYHPVLPYRCNNKFCSAYVSLAPSNKTLRTSARTRRSLRRLSRIRGSSTRREWPCRRGTKSSKFMRCTKTTSPNTTGERVAAVSLSNI